MGRARQGGAEKIGNLDPATGAWLRKGAQNRAALSRKQKRERERVRARYDMDPEVKSAVEAIAGREGVLSSASQTGGVLLAWAVREFARGNAEIREAFYEGGYPARTPQFERNLEIPEDWIEEIAAFLRNGSG
jgi:hypothetical protein